MNTSRESKLRASSLQQVTWSNIKTAIDDYHKRKLQDWPCTYSEGFKLLEQFYNTHHKEDALTADEIHRLVNILCWRPYHYVGRSTFYGRVEEIVYDSVPSDTEKTFNSLIDKFDPRLWKAFHLLKVVLNCLSADLVERLQQIPEHAISIAGAFYRTNNRYKELQEYFFKFPNLAAELGEAYWRFQLLTTHEQVTIDTKVMNKYLQESPQKFIKESWHVGKIHHYISHYASPVEHDEIIKKLRAHPERAASMADKFERLMEIKREYRSRPV
ncbi:MAG: hypothetical protein ACYCQI_07730 [Gammaproteobacteria bacterium]